MGWWSDHVVPRLVDKTLQNAEVDELRDRVCAVLHGRVLEVGFGSGPNLAHYPPAVTAASAVEPSDVAWRAASARLDASPVDVRRAGLDGRRLELADASHDSALSTFTLCTIPDVETALAEIRRVLRPGGRFGFLEHGLAPEPGVARWQHRLDPWQGRVFAGCHLDRPMAALVAAAGFRVAEVSTFYAARPRPWGYVYLGWAETA